MDSSPEWSIQLGVMLENISGAYSAMPTNHGAFQRLVMKDVIPLIHTSYTD